MRRLVGAEIFNSTIAFATNASAKAMVQRSRLRSMSEPPVEPPAVPTPNAPDMPASLPECRRISRMRMTAKKTSATESSV
jgi:hypothetical protein